MQILFLVFIICVVFAGIRTFFDVYKLIFKMFRKREVISPAKQAFITELQIAGIKKKQIPYFVDFYNPFVIAAVDESLRMHFKEIIRQEVFIAHKIANNPLQLPPVEKVTEQKPAEAKPKNKPIIIDNELDSFMPMKKNKKTPDFIELSIENEEGIQDEYMGG